MYKKILSLILLFLIPFPNYAEFKDPTQPAYPANPAINANANEEEPKLSAIWMSSRSKWATINGVRVKQGQSIGDIKIVKIHKNTVIIDQNGSIKTLQLLQRPYKTLQYKGTVLND